MTASKATKASSVAQWKKKSQGDLIDLPSGLTIRLKRVGLQALMATGQMPNSLLAISQKAVSRGTGNQGPSPEELAKLTEDPKQLIEMMNFFDRMVCFVAAEPEIHLVPKEGVDRDDNLVYVDEVGEEDKMFIFQVVTGGTTDLEEFRSEHASRLDALRRGEDLELPTK